MKTMMTKIPAKFTREGNLDHEGAHHPVSRPLAYGTAGFRCHSGDLPFVLFRTGVLAGIRAKYLEKTLGVMVTASHNPENDNGVKIIDPQGEMLSQDWEDHIVELVNSRDDTFEMNVKKLMNAFNITNNMVEMAQIFCAYDTRNSSKYLHNTVKNGCEYINVKFVSFALLTTPQLHFIVRSENDKTFGASSEFGYYQMLSSAFIALNQVTNNDY